jgi:hypothetical protein
MRMKKLITSFILLFISLALYSQRCALGVTANPELRQRHDNLQRVIDSYSRNQHRKLRDQEEIIRIPVVVHVIHNNREGITGGENNTNISDEQIFSQIKVLNEDFRRLAGTPGYNDHPDGADMGIEFLLAQVDPSGNPTSGITRTYNQQRNFDIFGDLEYISSLARWDVNRYLNIWVVDLAGSYLGYGEFPGGALDGLELSDPPEETDGVFIDYKVFGRQTGAATSPLYGYGRTLTHEIGHWLGLIHIWGDRVCGDDYCDDTPPAESENNTETCTAIYSRCSGVRTRNMIENFMDYSPDLCMNIFTGDQKSRTRIVFEVSQRRRRILLNSQFLLPQIDKADLRVLNNPGTATDMSLQILLPRFMDFNLAFYDVQGREVRNLDYLDYPSTVISLKDINLPSGWLIVRLTTAGETIVKRLMVY